MKYLPIEAFTPYTDDMLDLLKRLVTIESPTTDKTAVDRCGTLVLAELQKRGAAVQTIRQVQVGDHIIARWGEGAGGLLVLCHMDTVWEVGTLTRRPLQVKDGKLYGPGTLDMKGGIVVLLAALGVLQERHLWPMYPITALFTSDEETGSDTSRSLIEELAKNAALCLCLESTLANGSLKTARKGTGDILLTARGRAAHAGVDHEKGRNAIEELAHHILAAQKLTDYSQGTTVNVGVIQGGTRSNVVPDEAHAEVDFRVTSPAETERLAAWAKSLQPVLEGTTISARVTVNRPPMVRDEKMASVFHRVQSIGREIGLDLREGSTGGGSDANFVAALGVTVLDGLGVVGDGAHAEHEHVQISSLPERAALLAAILMGWK